MIKPGGGKSQGGNQNIKKSTEGKQKLGIRSFKKRIIDKKIREREKKIKNKNNNKIYVVVVFN